MTKTDLGLSISLGVLLLLYLMLCSSSIINLIPGTLYSQSTIKESKTTELEYQDPGSLNIFESMANIFHIPVRTLGLVITLVISLTWGIYLYTATANIALASVSTIVIFFISKVFLGV
jgi:hypothetical protein